MQSLNLTCSFTSDLKKLNQISSCFFVLRFYLFETEERESTSGEEGQERDSVLSREPDAGLIPGP